MKKFLILIIISLITFLCFILILNICKNNIINNPIHTNNISDIFGIEKITCFSSANAITNPSTKASWNLDIFQFTDIAIYINSKKDINKLTDKNIIKNLYLDSFSFTTLPKLGNPNIYYKNINSFGSPNFSEENIINKNLNYTIINLNSEINYEKPELYCNATNPITITYINKNITDNNIIWDTTTPLSFNGNLLQKSKIMLNSINCTISFNINITNNLNEIFSLPVNVSIPLEDTENNKTIYDGYIIKETKY